MPNASFGIIMYVMQSQIELGEFCPASCDMFSLIKAGDKCDMGSLYTTKWDYAKQSEQLVCHGLDRFAVDQSSHEYPPSYRNT